MAHNVMIGDKGTATKLMYQIFVALNKKSKREREKDFILCVFLYFLETR